MSRTIRRKNGCHHFTPSPNLLNPVWVNEQKEVDGIWYLVQWEWQGNYTTETHCSLDLINVVNQLDVA